MTIPLVIGLLFLCGTAYNLIAAEGSLANAVASACIAGVFGAVHLFQVRSEAEIEKLVLWLMTNAEQVKSSGEYYGNTLITAETQLSQYFLTVSCFIISIRIPSRLFIKGKERTAGTALVCSLVTGLLGWWAIPWGPVRTVQSLYYNLRGGKKQIVAELLTPAEPQAS